VKAKPSGSNNLVLFLSFFKRRCDSAKPACSANQPFCAHAGALRSRVGGTAATARFYCAVGHAQYGRGLSFIGDYAIFGISKPRHDGYVPDFPLHDRLKALHLPDRCQLIAVNLKTGHVTQAITFEGAAREFFDTVVIPDCRNGVIMNLDEAQHPQLITCAQNELPVPA